MCFLTFASVALPEAGILQFLDGAANLGVWVPMNAGFAFGGFLRAARGIRVLTCDIHPSGPGSRHPSTSNPVMFTFWVLFVNSTSATFPDTRRSLASSSRRGVVRSVIYFWKCAEEVTGVANAVQPGR